MIDSTKASLFTTVYPKENAETVIILHGGPGVPMDFSTIAEPLVPKYRVIAAGHIAWKHNKKKFDAIMKDFYRLPS